MPTDLQLADARDLAETASECRAAARLAWKMYGDAMETGDLLGARMYRMTYEELERRYFAQKKAERG